MSPASLLDPQRPRRMSYSRSPIGHREPRTVAEAERASLHRRNRDAAVQLRRKRAIDLYTRGKLSEVEFDAIAADVEQRTQDSR